MKFFRTSDADEEALAVRRLKRFRGLLLLMYVALWLAGISWLLAAGPNANDHQPGYVMMFTEGTTARVVWMVISVPLLAVLHLFSLAVMGSLFQLKLQLWVIRIVTPIAGLLLTWGFLRLCFSVLRGG